MEISANTPYKNLQSNSTSLNMTADIVKLDDDGLDDLTYYSTLENSDFLDRYEFADFSITDTD